MIALVLLLVAASHAQTLAPVSALVLTRHGARSPYLSIPGLHLETWDCSFSVFQYPQTAPVSNTVNFDGQLFRKAYLPHREALPGNCSQGQLTEVGAEQLRSTGKWLRGKLNDFLPAKWDSTTMFARSTDLDRTYASAENLLSTLFAPSSPSREGQVTTDVINIWTIEKGYDDLDVEQNFLCPRLKQECASITASAAWQSHVASTGPLRVQLAQMFNVSLTTLPDIFLVLEVLRARAAQGLPTPGLTTEIYNQVQAAATWELVALYNNSLVHTLTSGQILAEWVSIFQGVMNGTLNRTFSLFAAHDTTVAPMVLALQMPLKVWPNYASNLYLGLLRSSSGDYFVETIHDGLPARMAGCSANPCPWAEFLAVASQSFVADRAAACGVSSRQRSVKLFDPVAAFLC